MTHRGTTNGNSRGGSDARRRRREWLVQTYRADVDAVWFALPDGIRFGGVFGAPHGEGEAACRCYRCGLLLTVETVTVDRIIPGCQGGTYKRSNIRPACLPCNSKTGATLRSKK